MKMSSKEEEFLLESFDNEDFDDIVMTLEVYPYLVNASLSDGWNILTYALQYKFEIAQWIAEKFPESISFKNNDRTILEYFLENEPFEISKNAIEIHPDFLLRQITEDLSNNKDILRLIAQFHSEKEKKYFYSQLENHIGSMLNNHDTSLVNGIIEKYYTHANKKQLSKLIEILHEQNSSLLLTHLIDSNPHALAIVKELAAESPIRNSAEFYINIMKNHYSDEEMDDFVSLKLVQAIDHRNEKMIEMIIGLHPNIINKYNVNSRRSPLALAIIRNLSPEIIQKMVQASEQYHSPCVFEGEFCGRTPLTLAAEYATVETVQKILALNDDPNAINQPDMLGLVAKGYANVNFRDESMPNLFKGWDLPPSLDQGTLLSKLSAWLSKQTTLSLENQGYDLNHIEELKTELQVGHCSGFSWIHRIYTYQDKYDLFIAQMSAIANWDPNTEKNDVIDRIMNEMLQIIIFSQQAQSLELLRDDPVSTKSIRAISHEQHSESIAHTIAPINSQSHFTDTSIIYTDPDFKKYSKENLQKKINELTGLGGMIYLAGITNNAVVRARTSHAIDIGALDVNGDTYYWIYNPNNATGRKEYADFESFYQDLNAAFFYYPAEKSLSLQLHGYYPPTEYQYIVSNNLGHCTEETFNTLLRNAHSMALYDHFEIEIPNQNSLYFHAQEGKLVLKNHDPVTNKQNYINFYSTHDVLAYLKNNGLTPENIYGIEIKLPNIPFPVAKIFAGKFIEENEQEKLRQLIRQHPKLIDWMHQLPDDNKRILYKSGFLNQAASVSKDRPPPSSERHRALGPLASSRLTRNINDNPGLARLKRADSHQIITTPDPSPPFRRRK